MKIFLIAATFVLLIVFLFHFSRRNLDEIKNIAPCRISEFEYDIVQYEGYTHSVVYGAKVWYMVKKKNENQRYSLSLIKWGDEYHMYGPEPVDNVNILRAPKE